MMAFIGIGQFTIAAFHGNVDRLSGLMENPNAMGAMLVLGWFALQSCLGEVQEGESALKRFFQGLEFITLVALALTLSFGSFGAFGIGIISMRIYGKENLSILILRTAEIIFAVGCGILLYIAGDTNGNLTIHNMFREDTECPGPYLESRMEEIAERVNKNLNSS